MDPLKRTMMGKFGQHICAIRSRFGLENEVVEEQSCCLFLSKLTLWTFWCCPSCSVMQIVFSVDRGHTNNPSAKCGTRTFQHTHVYKKVEWPSPYTTNICSYTTLEKKTVALKRLYNVCRLPYPWFYISSNILGLPDSVECFLKTSSTMMTTTTTVAALEHISISNRINT